MHACEDSTLLQKKPCNPQFYPKESCVSLFPNPHPLAGGGELNISVLACRICTFVRRICKPRAILWQLTVAKQNRKVLIKFSIIIATTIVSTKITED